MAVVGWVGLGDIGEPMAVRMIEAKHETYVWGRTPERLKPATDRGAKIAASPADLARKCDVIFLCITDADAVEQTVFGADGVSKGASAAKVLVDHSSIHPHRSRLMAERLRSETGMGWLDAPVSGGRVGAQQGTLAVFVGGDEADLEKVRPLLAAYAARVTHVGASGSGQVAKTVNQSVVCATMAAWAETLNYAYRAGADVSLILQALEGSWSDSPIRKLHAQYMIAGQYPPGQAATMLKDMDVVGEMARVTKSPMPVNSIVASLFRQQILMGFDKAGPPGMINIYHQGPMTAETKK
jgi:3-hydroxyisobutyrate dehydrogenase